MHVAGSRAVSMRAATRTKPPYQLLKVSILKNSVESVSASFTHISLAILMIFSNATGFCPSITKVKDTAVAGSCSTAIRSVKYRSRFNNHLGHAHGPIHAKFFYHIENVINTEAVF